MAAAILDFQKFEILACLLFWEDFAPKMGSSINEAREMHILAGVRVV